MVREVALSDGEQTRNGCHQLVVYPDTTHGIVDSREDHHRVVILHAIDFLSELARVDVGNLLIHVEEVAVTLQDLVDAKTVDRLGEVKEHGKTCVIHTKALVATLLGST